MPDKKPGPFELLNDPEILGEGVSPEAAIEFWKQRAKLTWEEAKGLAEGARARAFYVTGLYQQDLVKQVSDALQQALQSGETLVDFKKRIADAIEKQGWKDYRVENIFNTNMQSAYAAGRYLKMQAVKKTRPYWQYYAIMDKRTRPSHAVLNGLVYPADHEFWNSNYPPNGFRCRCGVVTLSERQVASEGLTVQKEMPKPQVWTDPKTNMEYFVHFPGADNGFRNNPFAKWAENGGIDNLPGLEGFAKIRKRSSKKDVPSATPAAPTPEPPSPPAAPAIVVKPVATNKELEAEIIKHLSQFTRNGPITRVDFLPARYFMATNSQGRYVISETTNQYCNNFNAAKDLKSAWNKIANSQKLTFNEEYALESLWHETVHNRQTPTSAGANPSKSRTMMETVTQWVARRTYPQFMAKLGGQAAFQEQILKGGYGYAGWIRNFDRLLNGLGIADDATILTHLENVIKTSDRKQYRKAVCDYLFANKNKKTTRAALNNLLNNLDLGDRSFEDLLRVNAIIP